MKKLFITLSLAVSAISFAQCNIVGKVAINPGEEETYTLENGQAQCKDCHLWVSVGNGINFLVDNRQNSVKIKANQSGRQVLSLVVLSSQGIAQCSKNIDVLVGSGSTNSNMVNNTNDTTASATRSNSNCDVQTSDYKDVKFDTGIVSFFPNSTASEYKYAWTVNYEDGSTKQSSEKVPQFSYSKDLGIRSVEVKITSSKCMKKFTKTYDKDFWKFF